MVKFEEKVYKLVTDGLWYETDYPVNHRFGNIRFITYAKPKPGTFFWLGGKKWGPVGIRSIKLDQYDNEVYTGQDHWLHHVEIKMSEYRPYEPDLIRDVGGE